MNSQNANAQNTMTPADEVTDDQIETIVSIPFGSWMTGEAVWEATKNLLPATVGKDRALPICAKVAQLHNSTLER